jgi:hypothetical protein
MRFITPEATVLCYSIDVYHSTKSNGIVFMKNSNQFKSVKFKTENMVQDMWDSAIFYSTERGNNM